MSGIDETADFIPVRIAVLTITDTRTFETDTSGALLVEKLQQAGHHLANRQIAKDDVTAIRDVIKQWSEDSAVDCIITTGGTGLTGRDVTPEAIEPLCQKSIDGFSVLFHQVSAKKIGTSTLQSRAFAGITNGTLVFCLPGSTGACADGWDGILRWQLDSRHRPCNFVSILPRLLEHRST
ncbi:MAG: molybdenum cofactor biosynthesis protein B [Pseudomonadota bacterium]